MTKPRRKKRNNPTYFSGGKQRWDIRYYLTLTNSNGERYFLFKRRLYQAIKERFNVDPPVDCKDHVWYKRIESGFYVEMGDIIKEVVKKNYDQAKESRWNRW